MKSVAKFEKVSRIQFEESLIGVDMYFADQTIDTIYNDLLLPQRVTTKSAGYNFYLPYDIIIYPGNSVTIPTCIKCNIEEGYVLQLYIKSGLSFKYGLQLANSVGVIDSDYYFSRNEGHIIAKLVNTGLKPVTLFEGQPFMQGVFTQFFIAN